MSLGNYLTLLEIGAVCSVLAVILLGVLICMAVTILSRLPSRYAMHSPPSSHPVWRNPAAPIPPPGTPEGYRR
jgi:hypothetical protein